MAEYIAKGKLIDYFKDTYGGGIEENTCVWYQDIIRDIEETPAVDVAPVVHGKWEDIFQNSPCGWSGRCSICSVRNDIPHPFIANYCPNCGAKMNGGSVK